MKKNEIYEAEITGMTNEGAGVCRVDNMAVFVPMTAVGDRLRVRIVKVLKSYAFGIVEELLASGGGRCEPDCPVFRQCGGCSYRHVRYETELQYKAQQVQDAFERIGGLHPEFLPILGDTARIGYRNKAQYPVAEQDGRLVCGFYAKHSHRVVPYTRCALQPERFAELIEWLLPRLQDVGVTAYNGETHTGELRHIYIRQGYRSGELALCFVVRVSIRQKIEKLIPEDPRQVSGSCQHHGVPESRQNECDHGKNSSDLDGGGRSRIPYGGNRIELSPLSFYQVNTAQAERLYGIGREFAALSGSELLLDLYCGAGTIGLSMAQEVRMLIGVEVIPEAVENAAEKRPTATVLRMRSFTCGRRRRDRRELRQGSAHARM